jgi:hypothetical protein
MTLPYTIFDSTCNVPGRLPREAFIINIDRLHGVGRDIHGHQVVVLEPDGIRLLSTVSFDEGWNEDQVKRVIGSVAYHAALKCQDTNKYFQYEGYALEDMFGISHVLTLSSGGTVALTDCDEKLQWLVDSLHTGQHSQVSRSDSSSK